MGGYIVRQSFCGQTGNHRKVVAVNGFVDDRSRTDLQRVVCVECTSNNQNIRGSGEGEGKSRLGDVGDIIVEVLSQHVPQNVACQVVGKFVSGTLAAKDAWKTDIFVHTARCASTVSNSFDPV